MEATACMSVKDLLLSMLTGDASAQVYSLSINIYWNWPGTQGISGMAMTVSDPPLQVSSVV